MSFASDNWAGASPAVMAALAAANEGSAPAYGTDPWTGRAQDALRRFFEHDVAVFFVSTGSAANALALAAYGKAGGVVLCHPDAHLARDEAGAPGLYAPGSTLDFADGPEGRMDTEALTEALDRYPDGVVHHGRPAAVSITNVNEFGQTYRASDVAALAAIAKGRGLAVHMDGARFANALVHTGASPAELTWRAGVDVLSLGFTKTGAWCAEAIVFFDPGMREDAAYRHKQAAQLLSKNRFAAAQFCALLDDNHALELAGHANGMAAALGEVIVESPMASLAVPVQSNEVFAFVAPQAGERLAEHGVAAYPWATRSRHAPVAPAQDWQLTRFVASWRTTMDDIHAARQALG